jgi:hypothetical protein
MCQSRFFSIEIFSSLIDILRDEVKLIESNLYDILVYRQLYLFLTMENQKGQFLYIKKH